MRLKPVLHALVPMLLAGALLPSAVAQYTQQGNKLVGTGAGSNAQQGGAVAISADGNTALVGGNQDEGDHSFGAVWTFTRRNGVWSQRGGKLTQGFTCFGSAIAISADGNTALVGGFCDEPTGAAWVYTQSNGVWIQQGKLVGAGAIGDAWQGLTVALSADGNTALVGGYRDNDFAGAAWVFTRNGGVWSQQGNKLVGAGAIDPADQGFSVALSADGNTAILAGRGDNGDDGAVWVFTRSNGVWSQQGGKLALSFGWSVAISGDGNTAIAGTLLDAFLLTRTNGVWSRQGASLGVPGGAVSMSGDGTTAIVATTSDNNGEGAAWVFKRRNGVWGRSDVKLVGTGAAGAARQGGSVAISADGSTVILGGNADNAFVGAAWVFAMPSTASAPTAVSPASGSGTTTTLVLTFSDPGGWQNLTVVDALINNVLDGRQACYVAFVPSGVSSSGVPGGSVLLVDDAGDAGGPYSGMVLPGNGIVRNNQCSITGTGSSVAGSGNTLTLTLAISFTPAFAGNKVIYLASQNASANSGWQALGTWNAPGAAVPGPAVSGINPGRSASSTQTYTFTFSDTNGWQDIAVANVLINSAINGVGACYLAFVPAGANTGVIDLVDNAGDAAGPYVAVVLPGSGGVSNNQCTIAGSGSSAAAGGNTLTLTLAVTFSHSFAGNQVIYAAARSNTLNSGWQAVGTVAVP